MFVFFFKQKTAYEMRISDWSSDVCSSDLTGLGSAGHGGVGWGAGSGAGAPAGGVGGRSPRGSLRSMAVPLISVRMTACPSCMLTLVRSPTGTAPSSGPSSGCSGPSVVPGGVVLLGPPFCPQAAHRSRRVLGGRYGLFLGLAH